VPNPFLTSLLKTTWTITPESPLTRAYGLACYGPAVVTLWERLVCWSVEFKTWPAHYSELAAMMGLPPAKLYSTLQRLHGRGFVDIDLPNHTINVKSTISGPSRACINAYHEQYPTLGLIAQTLSSTRLA
jgi:hypothetical protein